VDEVPEGVAAGPAPTPLPAPICAPTDFSGPAGIPVPTDLSGARGVQVTQGSGTSIQVNLDLGHPAPEEAVATDGDFRADLVAMLRALDAKARTGYLPAYLQAGADVAKMARTVRLIGRVRRAPDRRDRDREVEFGKGGSRVPKPAPPENERMYAPPSELDDRADEAARAWAEVVAEHERLVVLGDPGMGKSWLIRTETHRLAESAIAALTDPAVGLAGVVIPVPIRADVLAAADGRRFPDAVVAVLAAQELLPTRSLSRFAQVVAQGGVTLLIDALDEVPRQLAQQTGAEPRKRLDDLLRGWVQDCPGAVRCVLTSRLAGYSGSPVPGAREVELLPFTSQDVRDAMREWHLRPVAAGRVRQHLDSPGVAGMSRIPLLLALLCSLAAQLPDQEPLPTTRTALYRAVTWRFLSGDHRSTDPGSRAASSPPTERETLLPILADLALAFADTPSGWVDRMPHADLAGRIARMPDLLPSLGGSSSQVIRTLIEDTGVLVPAGNPRLGEQSYMFLHRTFAEYLVARRMTEMSAPERTRLLNEHQWFDPAWSEVFPLLGGLLAAEPATVGQARDLVRHFLFQRRDPLYRAFSTALRILGEAPRPDDLLGPAENERIERVVVACLDVPAIGSRIAATCARMPAWPSVLTEVLPRLTIHPRRPVRRAAVMAVASRNEDEWIQLVLDRLYDVARSVRDEALRSLARHEHPEIVMTLRDCARHSNVGVRVTAVEGLMDRAPAEAEAVLLAPLKAEDTMAEYAIEVSPLRRKAKVHAFEDQDEPSHDRRFLDLLLNLSESYGYADTLNRFGTESGPAIINLLLERLDEDEYPPRARAAIVRTLKERREPAVVAACARALRRHPPPDAPEDSEPVSEEQQLLDILARSDEPAALRLRVGLRRALAQPNDSRVLPMAGRLLDSDALGLLFNIIRQMTTATDSGTTQAGLDHLGGPDRATRARLQTILIADENAPEVVTFLLRFGKRVKITGTPFRVWDEAALSALVTYDDDRVPPALLAAVSYGNYMDTDIAVREVVARNDPRTLVDSGRFGPWLALGAHDDRIEVAARLVDRLYHLLPARDRTLVLKRLGRVTVWAVRLSGSGPG